MSAAGLARGVSAAAAPAAKSSARLPETGAKSTSPSSAPLPVRARVQTRYPDDPRRDVRLAVHVSVFVVAVVAVVAIAPCLNGTSLPPRLLSFSERAPRVSHFFSFAAKIVSCVHLPTVGVSLEGYRRPRSATLASPAPSPPARRTPWHAAESRAGLSAAQRCSRAVPGRVRPRSRDPGRWPPRRRRARHRAPRARSPRALRTRRSPPRQIDAWTPSACARRVRRRRTPPRDAGTP